LVEGKEGLAVGDSVWIPAPLASVTGEQLDLEGLVLLIFFDPSCAKCLDEAPIWNDFYERARKSVKVIGITRAQGNSLKAFMARAEIAYPIVSDPNGILFQLFRISKWPYNLLLENQKVVVIPAHESASVRLKEIEDYLGIF
jgi:peroxiredoxin